MAANSKQELEEGERDIERHGLIVGSRRAQGCSPLVREVLHWISHAALISIIAYLVVQQDPPAGTQVTTEIDIHQTESNHGLMPSSDEEGELKFTVHKGEGICSGHGTQHVAGSQSWCVCFDCWEGLECEQPSIPCYAVAKAGDPLVFEDYWVRHGTPVEVESGFKIGYWMEEGKHKDPFVELTQMLKSLHGLVRNIDTTDTYFVFGCGGTHLLAAALYAQSKHLSGGKVPETPVKVWEKRPYFGGHEQAGTAFETAYYQWQDVKPNVSEEDNVVEFVCGPNNPDGELRQPEFTSSRVIWDMAYRWPFYTPIAQTQQLNDHEVALFTISKLSGHAGTRFGWAVTKSKLLAEYMQEWVSQTTLNVPRDTAYRAKALLGHALQSDGQMLAEISELMAHKWKKLTEIFEGSTQFRLQPSKEPAEACLFEGKVKEPTPAYAWIECVGVDVEWCDAAPVDYFGDQITYCGCSKLLKEAGILANGGSGYGVGAEWVRVQLLQRAEDFELLAHKLAALVHS